ncbi:MAG: hypothetical protein RLY93_12485 [Sumerlaeia bacterium]
MSRLLVYGVGPRPHPGATKIHAPGLRLQTIAQALAEDGHEVTIIEHTFGNAADAPPVPPPPGVERAIALAPIGQSALGKQWYGEINDRPYDGVVALTDLAEWLAAMLWTKDTPLFVDYFGHPMAERQMQAHTGDNDAALLGMWRNVLPVLLRSDAFGVCSRAQRLALIGELGAAGRLNRHTTGYEFAHVLRPALPFSEPWTHSTPGQPYLRGPVVPPGARVILSTGGFNTWLDEKTLFEATDHVLADDPDAHFVATGGAISGHVESVYHRFEERVAASPHRERYHLLGWVPHERFVDACLEADLGVTCDVPTLEGEFGCRNRLFGWLWAGMRAVAADFSELTQDMAAQGLITTAAPQKPKALAAAMRRDLARGRLDRAAAAQRRQTLVGHFSPAKCYEPLLRWARDPKKAPDLRDGAPADNPLARAQHAYWIQHGEANALPEFLDRVEGSRLLRWWMKRNPDAARLFRRLRARDHS